MDTRNPRGIISRPSALSFDEAVVRFQGLLQSRNFTLFALIDHSGEADKVGIQMPPTKLIIFGSPRAGTPVMLDAPTSAIDLPLKLLVWEDAAGATWLSYNEPAYLLDRHRISPELLQNIGVVGTLLE